MDIEVTVPEIGNEVSEATFIAWLKGVGERVRAGETIAEIMTDKVNLEIESPAAGVIADQRAAPDQVVKVGAVIAMLTTD